MWKYSGSIVFTFAIKNTRRTWDYNSSCVIYVATDEGGWEAAVQRSIFFLWYNTSTYVSRRGSIAYPVHCCTSGDHRKSCLLLFCLFPTCLILFTFCTNLCMKNTARDAQRRLLNKLVLWCVAFSHTLHPSCCIPKKISSTYRTRWV